MESNNDAMWDAIANSLSNEEKDETDPLLKNWIDESELNKNSLNLIKQFNFQSKPRVELEIKKDVYKSVMERIQTENIDKPTRRKNYFWPIAASILVLISVGLGYKFWSKSELQVQLVEVYSPRGVRSKLKLNDGTSIVLNADSKLTYPVQFINNTREVSLEGEAYFEVAKNTDQPFVVNTKNIKVEVTGTKLNIKDYENDQFVKTTLIEGALNINSHYKVSHIIQLKPGEQACFLKNEKSFDVQKIDSKAVVWKEGKYVFKSQTFLEITQILERGLNIKIEIESEKLKKETFSGEFVNGENLIQILAIISLNENITYQVFQDKVIIKNKNDK